MNYAIFNRFTFNWIDFIRIVAEAYAYRLAIANAVDAGSQYKSQKVFTVKKT